VNIERGTFLLLVSTLAIGATGGYVAAERHWFPELDRWRGRTPEPTPEPPHPTAVADAAPLVAAAPTPVTAPVPAAPVCDDSVATVGECPPPGYPTVEGGCGSFANVRCGELKQAMKPKVAAAAVACLNKLTPQERCDPARVYLCGHLAFMNACPEREGANAGAGGNANANAGANAMPAATTTTTAADGAKSVASICQAIVEGCGTSPVAPSMAECRQLLSGMTDYGRERTRTCMKTHCFDRGLVGCEGVTK
jgi:hypothetical protein